MHRRLPSVVALSAALLLLSSSTASAAPGDIDSSFGDDGVALVSVEDAGAQLADVAPDPTGRIVAAGAVATGAAFFESDALVARFTADGELDGTFGEGGVAVLDFGESLGVAMRVGALTDSSVVVSGLVLSVEENRIRVFLAKLTASGVPDATFGDAGVIYVGGEPEPEGGDCADEDVPPTFIQPAGMAVDTGITLATTELDFESTTSPFQTVLRRYSASGAPDVTFGGGDGVAEIEPSELFLAADMAATPTGFVIAGVAETGPAVLRTDRFGALDPTFGADGVATAPMALDGQATSVVADPVSGAVTFGGAVAGDTIVGRFDASGALDDSFGVGGVRSLPSAGSTQGGRLLGVDADGRPIVLTVAGDLAEVHSALHRLQADGRRDDGFGAGGQVALDTVGPDGLAFAPAGGRIVADRLVVAGSVPLDESAGLMQGAIAAFELGGDDASTPAPASVERVAAEDRVATAIALSQEHFAPDTAPRVVLAAGDRFADALVAVAYAESEGAPLLLTGGGDLDARAVSELRRVLGPNGPVTLIGGTGALAAEVENDVRGLGYTPTRLAGRDRFETASLVAERTTSEPAAILLATGRSFADALAAGAAAAHVDAVVLLTDDASPPPATNDFLRDHEGVRLFAIGGAAATAYPDAEPLVGTNRYETARLVAEAFFVTPPMAGVASGEGFADALSGGAHAAMAGGPLLLSFPGTLPADTIDYLSARADFLDRVVLYGGNAALSEAVEAGARNAVS